MSFYRFSILFEFDVGILKFQEFSCFCQLKIEMLRCNVFPIFHFEKHKTKTVSF